MPPAKKNKDGTEDKRSVQSRLNMLKARQVLAEKQAEKKAQQQMEYIESSSSSEEEILITSKKRNKPGRPPKNPPIQPIPDDIREFQSLRYEISELKNTLDELKIKKRKKQIKKTPVLAPAPEPAPAAPAPAAPAPAPAPAPKRDLVYKLNRIVLDY